MPEIIMSWIKDQSKPKNRRRRWLKLRLHDFFFPEFEVVYIRFQMFVIVSKEGGNLYSWLGLQTTNVYKEDVINWRAWNTS